MFKIRRGIIGVSAILLCPQLQATLILFAPATDGYVLGGDKRITDTRTDRTIDSETKVRAIPTDMAWSAVGNTAFYRNLDRTVFRDAFAITSAVIATKKVWDASELADRLKTEHTQAFKPAFENQEITVAPRTSLFQTLVFKTESDGVRLILTTFFFQRPNVLTPYVDDSVLNRVSGWGSGGAFLREVWRGNRAEFDNVRANEKIMNFLNEKPRLPVTQAARIAKEVIRIASEHAHLFPNVGASPTSDCLVLPSTQK